MPVGFFYMPRPARPPTIGKALINKAWHTDCMVMAAVGRIESSSRRSEASPATKNKTDKDKECLSMSNTTKFAKSLGCLLAAAALAVSSTATALPFLKGNVDYTGAFSLNPGVTGTNFTNATSLSIVTAEVDVPFTSGDFLTLGMANNDLITHATPLSTTAALNTSIAGFNPLWTWTNGMNTVQFVLTSYKITQRTSNQIDYSGVGYFTATGYNDTSAEWDFSANLSGNLFRGTYSATSAVPVPEPTALALFGMTLLGAAGALRKKKSQA